MIIFDRSRRLLFGAFAISTALHLLAVFGAGWPQPSPPAAAAPLRVVVAAPVADAALPAPAATATTTAPPPAGPPPRAAAKRLPDHRPLPPMATPPEAPPRLLAPAAEVGAPVAPSLPPEAAADTAARPATAGVSADSLRQYRIDLAVAARRFRSYPALARARGWEGVAEVSLSASAGLPVPVLRLTRSSGQAVLDEQAMQMLSQAMASTPLPEGLRGRSFVVLLPIRFSLDD